VKKEEMLTSPLLSYQSACFNFAPRSNVLIVIGSLKDYDYNQTLYMP